MFNPLKAFKPRLMNPMRGLFARKPRALKAPSMVRINPNPVAPYMNTSNVNSGLARSIGVSNRYRTALSGYSPGTTAYANTIRQWNAGLKKASNANPHKIPLFKDKYEGFADGLSVQPRRRI